MFGKRIRHSVKRVVPAGPLDQKTVRLVKLALAIGAKSEGAVHSHVRRRTPRRHYARGVTTGSTARRDFYRPGLRAWRHCLGFKMSWTNNHDLKVV